MKAMLNLIGWIFVAACYVIAGWMILSYIDIVIHNITTQEYMRYNLMNILIDTFLK